MSPVLCDCFITGYAFVFVGEKRVPCDESLLDVEFYQPHLLNTLPLNHFCFETDFPVTRLIQVQGVMSLELEVSAP